MRPPRIGLFAKAPTPGRVKTRLVPPLSAEQACALYEAFLLDQLNFLDELARQHGISWELCLDGVWRSMERGPSVMVRPQGPGDLGARMERWFGAVFQEGATAALAVGADAPTLPGDAVLAALEAVTRRRADACAVPATDGGYVCLALGRPAPVLFRGIPWGTPEVWRRTQEAARRAGLKLAALPAWGDVDVPADLRRLRAELAGPGRRRAPRTAEALERIAGHLGD